MSARRVIGVDPGPIPGIVVLDLAALPDRQLLEASVVQCTAGLLWDVLGAVTLPGTLFAAERFVVRGRATKDQALTRDQAAALEAMPCAVVRSAAQVKPWATDARLEAAGLLEACKGMRHARDAARHALFAAVHDRGLPDPLSKDWTR